MGPCGPGRRGGGKCPGPGGWGGRGSSSSTMARPTGRRRSSSGDSASRSLCCERPREAAPVPREMKASPGPRAICLRSWIRTTSGSRASGRPSERFSSNSPTPRRSSRTADSSWTDDSSGRLGSRKTASSPRPGAEPGGSPTYPGCGRSPAMGSRPAGSRSRRRTVAKLGQPLFATDLDSCEDWELEVRLYQECRVVVLPEVWSHVRWIDDGTRIGRACPGQPRSREQEMGLQGRSADRHRPVHPPGPTHAGSGRVLAGFRSHISKELARLGAAGA